MTWFHYPDKSFAERREAFYARVWFFNQRPLTFIATGLAQMVIAPWAVYRLLHAFGSYISVNSLGGIVLFGIIMLTLGVITAYISVMLVFEIASAITKSLTGKELYNDASAPQGMAAGDTGSLLFSALAILGGMLGGPLFWLLDFDPLGWLYGPLASYFAPLISYFSSFLSK